MKTIKIASAAIFNTKNELLLVRKNGSDFFQLTGGKIDENESKLETVIREIKEEIGLEILNSELIYLGEHQTKAVNEKQTLVLGYIYKIHLKTDFEPIISNEIVEYAWLNTSNYLDFKWAHLAKEFVLPICKKIWK